LILHFIITILFYYIYLSCLKNSFRLTSFQDSWPKLEKWFLKFQNVLQTLDGDTPQGIINFPIRSESFL